jgi:hypothetical protein
MLQIILFLVLTKHCIKRTYSKVIGKLTHNVVDFTTPFTWTDSSLSRGCLRFRDPLCWGEICSSGKISAVNEFSESKDDKANKSCKSLCYN